MDAKTYWRGHKKRSLARNLVSNRVDPQLKIRPIFQSDQTCPTNLSLAPTRLKADYSVPRGFLAVAGSRATTHRLALKTEVTVHVRCPTKFWGVSPYLRGGQPSDKHCPMAAEKRCWTSQKNSVTLITPMQPNYK